MRIGRAKRTVLSRGKSTSCAEVVALWEERDISEDLPADRGDLAASFVTFATIRCRTALTEEPVARRVPIAAGKAVEFRQHVFRKYASDAFSGLPG